jgi:hypothetical protein
MADGAPASSLELHFEEPRCFQKAHGKGGAGAQPAAAKSKPGVAVLKVGRNADVLARDYCQELGLKLYNNTASCVDKGAEVGKDKEHQAPAEASMLATFGASAVPNQEVRRALRAGDPVLFRLLFDKRAMR